MKKLITSLLIGAVAGIIDIIPMILQKLDRITFVSAFAFWVLMGFIIAHITLPIKNWKKGFLVAEFSIIPILILIAAVDIKSTIPVIITTAILGSLVGISTEKYAK